MAYQAPSPPQKPPPSLGPGARALSFLSAAPLRGWPGYLIGLAALALVFAVRLSLTFAGDEPLLELFLVPIFVGAYLGGFGPGATVTGVAALLTNFYLLDPMRSLFIESTLDRAEWLFLLATGLLMSALIEALHRTRQRAEADRQLQVITLASIGDAVITTDAGGSVTFLNGEAERLTGWSNEDALGSPLAAVFRIFNEHSRAPIEDPASVVLRTGRVVGLANHTLLLARDGREIPIDDSGAPIRRPRGSISGVVLVFRDVSEQKQAEEAVARSERNLKLFVDHAPAAIAMFDRAMRYIAVSKRFLADYRIAEREIIGRSHYEIFPEIPERWRQIHRHCLTGAVEHCAEDPFPRLDGGTDWVRWELRPWYERPGVVGGLVLFSELITERKQAEVELRKSEARFHHILDNMLEGCQIIGPDWRYLYLNDSALKHSRVTREELIGRTMMEVFPGIETTPFFAVARRCAETQQHERLENYFVYPDGSAAWFDLSIQPSSEGIFILSIDITERKQAEQALAAERALLAERVETRTADLRIANAELARAARLKDEFLANMSHELRTPLNAILGRSELLQEGIYGPLGHRQADALRTIDLSSHHLLALINDILDLSKIAAGKLEIRVVAVDIGELFQRSLQMVSQSALAKQIAIEITLDPQVVTIFADERRLQQILVNLLSNAVKFTPKDGRIGLDLKGDPVCQTATFTVWDTGIGIAKEHLAQLFQPFSQIDSGLNRQYEGTGLGLSLVQRLAEAHGGKVSVESAVGRGSRFHVHLPWPGGPAQLAEPPPGAPSTTPEAS